MNDETTTEDVAEEPTESVTYPDGPHVEPVGSGGRISLWECSEGDFISRINEAEVDAHIAVTHSDAAKQLRAVSAKPKAKAKP